MNKEIDDEIKREMANEVVDGEYSEWFSDNKKELINEFVEDNQEDFDKFIEEKRASLEQDDLDYWKLLFCEEEMTDEFSDFCEDDFKDSMDILETENSLMKSV